MTILGEEQWQKDHRERVAAMPAQIRNAHAHCSRHAIELGKSVRCGCFYCLEIFEPSQIKDWIMEREARADFEPSAEADSTALCPRCGIDAVIGDAAGFPITSEFLQTMKTYWF